MTTAPPLDWIREIDAALVALDEKPQFGVPTPFDWEKFERGLQEVLQKPQLKIQQNTSEWIVSNQLFKGLGENLLALSIEWSPLHTPAFFVIEKQTIKNIINELLSSEKSTSYFYDSHLAEGFYHYLAAEALYLIEKQRFASPLTPRIGTYVEEMHRVIGEESCFATDLCLSINGKNFWGRMLLSESFRAEWKTYFAHQSLPMNEEIKRKIPVDISLEIAHTQLSLEEWKRVKNGDFVILDRCSYDPVEHNGAVDLTLNRKPLFRGRLKEGGVKITNYPVYEEVRDSMDDEPVRRDFEKDHENLDSDFDEDEESEFDEEEDLFLDLEEELAPKKEKKTTLTAKSTSTEEELKISPEELPVHLTIEVGRMRMTVGELLALAPGNLIDLHVAPEQGVDLVVNGKKVGRGELIRMGDVLGVRILSI